MISTKDFFWGTRLAANPQAEGAYNPRWAWSCADRRAQLVAVDSPRFVTYIHKDGNPGYKSMGHNGQIPEGAKFASRD